MSDLSTSRFGAGVRTHGLRLVAGLGVAALVGVAPMLPLSVASAWAPAWHVVAVGNTIPSNCSTDVSQALNKVLAAAVKGDEITLAHDGCYLAGGTNTPTKQPGVSIAGGAISIAGGAISRTDQTGVSTAGGAISIAGGAISRTDQTGVSTASGTISLANQTGVWINGNGATIRQPSYPGRNVVLPILQLSGDTDVTVTNLTLQGPSGVGNEYTEGDYGLKLTADDGVSISQLVVEDVEGDWVAVYPDSSGALRGALNRNISIVNSSFLNAGYHGVTIEAADGVTFDHDTFSGVGCDGVDLEYDIYPTVFVHGQPTGAAEDNVTFENTTWSNVRGVWVVSYQGQQVQEDNLALIDNRLVGVGLTVGIIGNQQVPNSGLLIEGNVSTTAASGVWGGAITSSTASAPIWLKYVDHLRIIDNSVALFDGTPTYFPNHPYMPAVQVYGNSGVTIERNTFNGAKSVLQADGLYSGRPWSGTPSNNVDVCSNSYGVKAHDATSAC